MKTYFLALLTFCITFLAPSCSKVTYKPSEKEKSADAVLEKVALKLKQNHGLYPCGEGGQMLRQIQMLALSFNYYEPLTIEEARYLLVESVNEFIEIINQDERIRPFLDEYPFKPKNVQIQIFMRNLDGSDFAPGKLCVISAIDGNLEYLTNDPNYPLFKTVHKETFEEALENLKTSNQKPHRTNK